MQQQSQLLAAKLEKQTGVGAQVSAQRINGELFFVTVFFDGGQPPPQTLPQLHALIQTQARQQFGEEAKNLQIIFNFDTAAASQ